MVANVQQGAVKERHLTGEQLTELDKLVEVCNNFEGLHMRLGEWLRKRPGDNVYDFLYYDNGKIVGYIAVDTHGVKKKEVTGMVHPDYRRRGIYRILLEEVKEEYRSKGVEQLILICEENSLSGLAFVDAIGAQYEFSEHEMVLGTFHEKQFSDDRLRVRMASGSDLDAIVAIMATDSEPDEDEESLRRWIGSLLNGPEHHFYLGVFGEESVSCGEPIGCLRLDEATEEVGIYGFVVRPDYRGKGYGRQIMEEAIRAIKAASSKRIMLDVDTQNANAIGLYSSCGFEVKITYDYYKLDMR